MSDTPETDAACDAIYSQGVAHIPLVGFMEKLERERNDLKAEAYKYIELWDRATKELESLKSNSQLND